MGDERIYLETWMIQLLVSLLTTGLLLMSLLEGRLKEIAAGEGIKLHKKNLILPLSHNENRASKVDFFSIFKKKYFSNNCTL